VLWLDNIDGLGRLNRCSETITKVGGEAIDKTYIYEYDMRSQLLSAYMMDYGSEPWFHDDYSYDKAGNVQSHMYKDSGHPWVTTPYTFAGDLMASANASNCYGPVTGDKFTLDWDDNGNLTLKDNQSSPCIPEPADDTALAYNWDNKLRSATQGPNTLSVKYDPAGNRVIKDSNVTGQRKYIVDLSGELPTILLEFDPNNGMAIKKTYIHANGQVLAQHDGDVNAPRYFYLHDRLGSVREVIDANASVVKYYTFDAFGKTLEEGGTLTNPFMFTGQWFDPETGMYYFRARIYDPPLMRFTTMDPVKGPPQEPMALHKYLYCGNDPINGKDPSGLWEEGKKAGGEDAWHGHSDMGYGGDDFQYEALDEAFPPSCPLFTRLHFLDLYQAEQFVYVAVLTGDRLGFGYAGHMGQDYFSHYEKGYRDIGGRDIVGHLENIEHNADNPDNPYVYDKYGNEIGLSSSYLEADRWTKQMEDLWYFFNN
jgi:RHS repeat-associated protein